MALPSNPLTDVLPDQARRYLYAIGWVVCLGLGIYKATEGDWLAFTVMLGSALGFGTAQSNVPTTKG